MLIRNTLAALCLVAIAVPAGATIDFNGALFDAQLAGRSVRQAQARQRRVAAPTRASRDRAICANRKRYAARLSADNARRLNASCIQYGYGSTRRR